MERLLPGMLLAGRYRIVARLGRGGMGEVYRADDLKLGQTVALKFLPERLQTNPRLLERLLNEVKLARKIAHPNVCRVYDAREVDGRHFLTMEYIDGEDLSCLLRRIGRVPQDKAVQIGGQLCAGLAAIHAQGILHRDLKPSNVMLDGQGQVRITDFGVAGVADSIPEGEISGTPEYMAPEQLIGASVHVKSDIYSLGLVLFEIFTGQRVFRSVAERLSEKDMLPAPEQYIEGLDPEIADVIKRCLEPHPNDRPGSARTVLAALPRSDTVRAMVDAGRTPPPEMVAAAGGMGIIERRVGGALMAVIVSGLLLIALAADDSQLFRRAPLDKPPSVLVDRAQTLLQSIGYTEPPHDVAYGFANGGNRSTMYFWYRQSPSHLDPRHGLGKVSAWDPPFFTPDNVNLVLDPGARLLELRASPTTRLAGSEPAEPPDWSGLFAAAGLDPAGFIPATPLWASPAGYDAFGAWDAADRGGSDTPIHVEAGLRFGKPVFFRQAPPREATILDRPPTKRRIQNKLFLVLYWLIIGGCLIQVRRNLRRGRGDRKGARRLAMYVLAITMLQWLLRANHTAEIGEESELLIKGIAVACYQAFLLCWVPYIALEPHIRRHWPEKIIAWTRLLAGRFRDPLVGRDILIGIFGAVVLELLGRLYYFLPMWWNLPRPTPLTIWPNTLLGPSYYISEFFRFQDNAIFYGFGLLFLLLAVKYLLRSEWLAVAVLTVLTTATWYGELPVDYPLLSLILTGLRMTVIVLILKRFGVLAVIFAIFIGSVLSTFPITVALNEWYAENAVFALVAVLALATYGLYTALGIRQPRPAD
jgi:serine/threonine-protein kinase